MGVTIQPDMFEAAQYMPESWRGPYVSALVAYGITGELPDESEPWYSTFHVCRGRLEMSVRRSQAGKKAAAKRWGHEVEDATDDPTDGDPDGYDMGTQIGMDMGTHNVDLIGTQNAEVRRGKGRLGKDRLGKGSSDPTPEPTKAKRFRAPSVEDVQAYATEQGLNIDPVRFVDYYVSVGWTVGRNKPMKDWKAAARRWSKNEYGDCQGGGDRHDRSAYDHLRAE